MKCGTRHEVCCAAVVDPSYLILLLASYFWLLTSYFLLLSLLSRLDERLVRIRPPVTEELPSGTDFLNQVEV